MSKSKDLKMINWILLGYIPIIFLTIMDWYYNINYLKIIGSIFLGYCFLSQIYWIIKKDKNMIIHFSLLEIICIIFFSIFISIFA